MVAFFIFPVLARRHNPFQNYYRTATGPAGEGGLQDQLPHIRVGPLMVFKAGKAKIGSKRISKRRVLLLLFLLL